MKAFSKRTKSEIYLEYVNDWLTIEAMAENYGRSVKWMTAKIDECREEYKALYG